MTVSAWRREDCRMVVLEARSEERFDIAERSDWRAESAESMAVRWAWRPWRDDSFWARERCRREYRVAASWWRRASFSGFGGIGGAGTWDDGISNVNGSSIRSGGGGGFGFG